MSKIEELRAALQQVLDDVESAHEIDGQWGPISLKTIALIKDLLADDHGCHAS